VLLGRELVRGAGRLDPRAWASALADWEQSMADQGSLDLLGPSTSRAIALIRQGVDPAEAGRGGTTNGAAMRIAPVGIAVPWGHDGVSRAAFLDAVVAACLPTHHTSLAIAGAAAVGAVVSAGVGGAADRHGWREVALEAAEG
ncbi:ADP-ribosylglycohydrolase family protein, partial [Bradyrhizobium sp. NBAIM03]|nr:ADP-ribosylglycohydrolase family protein [Bradyrhizobium sp. NBAIM03]